jgi:hypothetical protein
LPINIGITKKNLPWTNTLAYFATSAASKKKGFMTLTPSGPTPPENKTKKKKDFIIFIGGVSF